MRASPLFAVAIASLLAACSPPGDDGGTSTETSGASAENSGSSGPGGGGGQSATQAGGGGAGAESGTTTSSDGGGTGGTAGSGGTSTTGSGGGNGWGPDLCPEPPAGVTVGIEIGQQLPDFVVKNCAGEAFSLTELCGSKGLFVFAAHGWCPLCQNVSSNQEAIQDEFAVQGLASVNIVVQTGSSQPPTANYCDIWREEFGHDDVFTLYDDTGKILDLWPGSSSSLSAFVDADRVIVSKLYHDGNVETIKAHIQEALDH